MSPRGADKVGLIGGLGNQLFQYAFALWLRERTGRPVLFDLSGYRSAPEYLALDKLGLDIPRAHGLRLVPHPLGRASALAVAYRRIVGPTRVVFESASNKAGDVEGLPGSAAWYYGYWQLPKVVKSVIPELRSALSAIVPASTVGLGVHIRRGDMVGKAPRLAPDYYERSARLLMARHGIDETEVTVFSDDIEWCRANFGLRGVNFSEGGTAAQDLTAFASRSYLVLSPSTFSWWGATLKDRVPGSVVAPSAFPGAGVKLRDPTWLEPE